MRLPFRVTDANIGSTFTLHLTTVMLVTGPKGKCINSDGAFQWVP